MSDKKSPVAAFLSKFNFRGAIVPFVFLVAGVLFIVFPESSMNVICYVLGALMLAAGVARLIFAFLLPSDSRFADIIFAGVIIVVGILLIAAQSTVADFVTVVLGIVLIIDAVLKIEENVVLRKLNPARWRVMLAIAAVCLVLGVAVVALSFSQSENTSRILMILAGVSTLFDAICSFALLSFSAYKEVKAESAPAPEEAVAAADTEDGDDDYEEDEEDDEDEDEDEDDEEEEEEEEDE